jgi:hypothetical protein
MFDVPEILIIGLTTVLLVVLTRHWISTIAPDKSGTDRKR